MPLSTLIFLLEQFPPYAVCCSQCSYVEAKKDRVTAIFSTVFRDDDDVIIGKVFMQVSNIFVLVVCIIPLRYAIVAFAYSSYRSLKVLKFFSNFLRPGKFLIRNEVLEWAWIGS